MKRSFLFLPVLLSLFLLFSCSGEDQGWELEMPATPIMTGTSGWGVVNTAYLKISREPDNDRHIITTLREGDIVKVESIHYMKDPRGRQVFVWYHIRWENLSGWVREGYLDSYDTREKAMTASGMLIGS